VYEKYSTRGCVEKLIQCEAKLSAVFALIHPPSAVFFIHTSIGSALSDKLRILYFLFIWLGVTFSNTWIAAIFARQDVSEFL